MVSGRYVILAAAAAAASAVTAMIDDNTRVVYVVRVWPVGDAMTRSRLPFDRRQYDGCSAYHDL
jgi:hypothetical protein